jgi:phage gpG-like protein
MSSIDQINLWFDRFDQKFDAFPHIIAETAVEYFQERFTQENWDGVAWTRRKDKKPHRLLMKSRNLFRSIHPSEVTPELVRIRAGSPQVPYAQIHNEGGVIQKAARSETFVRNRYTKGPKSKAFGGMGLYKKGTKAGKGLTFKAHAVTMPKRQFMGVSAALNTRITERLRAYYNASNV